MHLEQKKVKWAEMFYKRAQKADPRMALVEVGFAKVALLYNNRHVCNEHLDKAAAMAPNDPVVQKAINNVRYPKVEVSTDNTVVKTDDDAAEKDEDKGKRKRKRRRRRNK